MIKIKRLHIRRYRSIMDLKIELDTNNNLITICGENNTGKTNILRAIDLFFNTQKYDPPNDAPYHKFEGSRGGAVFPEISIDFVDKANNLFHIEKKFNGEGLEKIAGYKIENGKKKNKEILEGTDIEKFLKNIHFFFIESINISFPKLINYLIEDLYDIEFERTRFSGLKAQLKESFDEYINGLLEILNDLAKEIDPSFKEYKADWGTGFDIRTDVKKFRDIITDDIVFYINDRSNKNIEGKGAGLQRLGYLLLHFRIIQKITSKSVILLIDEPDIFLHQGLQKKLYKNLIDISTRNQVFITTHSQIFIDSYTLKNVFLLDIDISEKEYVRKEKTFNILSTKLVDIDVADGAKKIRDYLGIENADYDLLDKYNILVEGESDKKYIEELLKYFKLDIPNIISANGADNIPKYLEFYNSFYKLKPFKPLILVLHDNDLKGREVFKKVNDKTFSRIMTWLTFVPNFLGEVPDHDKLDRINVNNEIEDFVYPQLICELNNRLLKHRAFKPINYDKVCRNIVKPAYKAKGILSLMEFEKNDKNPDKGNEISLESESMKSGVANRFVIQGDKKIIDIIAEEEKRYPAVRKFLENIVKPLKDINNRELTKESK